MSNSKIDNYADWRIRDFRNLLLGRLVFLMGTQAQAMALGWAGLFPNLRNFGSLAEAVEKD